MKDDRGLFSPVVLGFLIASVVAIFALSVVLTTIDSGNSPYKATLTSPSAIGHKGFYALLQKLDLPVSQTRINGQAETGPGGLLVVAEPDRKLMKFGGGSELGVAPNVLVILPKWTGKQDFFHDGWVREVTTLDEDVPRKIVELIDKKASIARGRVPWHWTKNIIGETPSFEREVQFVRSDVLKPLIADGADILLGEFMTEDQRIWVLSDPDPIENHGIATPANTRLVVALINHLRDADGRIVFDETVHGAIAPERNPFQLLFQFPFVIVTIELLVALLLLLLATTSRFGGTEEAPAPFALGKERLIDNIAALMDRAGHQAVVLRRYLSVKLGEAGRALHAPAGLDDPALAGWLDRIGRSRGIDAKASAIIARSAATIGGRSQTLSRLFDEARDIYRWNKDILDGSAGRQDHR